MTQRLLLWGSVLLLGAGAARLVRHLGPSAAGAAAAVATWNPYVVERLLLGQAPTLLACSMAPWLVVAAAARGSRRRRVARLLLTAAPAALTPLGGVVAAVVVTATAALTSGARRATAYAALGLAWCLPWLVPALVTGATRGDGSGARAFAVTDDSALGLAGSVLTLGGIWAPGAHLASRQGAVALGAAVVLAGVAAAGVTRLRARAPRRALGLLALWLGPVALVLTLASPPGVAVLESLQAVPGVGLVRDTHRLLGASVIALAVLAGHAVAGPSGARQPDRPGGRADLGLPGRSGAVAPAPRAGARAALAVVVGSLAVLSVPDAPARLWAAYRPVDFPAGWKPAMAAVPSQARAVLVLPWQPVRATRWAPGPFLDPTPRALAAPVLSARDLTVRRDGERVLVRDGDPDESSAWARGVLDDAALRAHRVDAVIEWKGTAGRRPTTHPGLVRVYEDAELVVWARHAG